VIGVSLAALLASAGVVGVALGFGAQNLVRDVLAGWFILVEDRYGVGDTIDAGAPAVGVVERVTLRSTRLRDVNGTVWHVANGEIVRVGNKSQNWSRAVVDVVVRPEADIDRACALLDEVHRHAGRRGVGPRAGRRPRGLWRAPHRRHGGDSADGVHHQAGQPVPGAAVDPPAGAAGVRGRGHRAVHGGHVARRPRCRRWARGSTHAVVTAVTVAVATGVGGLDAQARR
jgi:hypothetical protein